MELSLKNKNILATGVSRSKGIGATIAKVLARAGANVVIHGYWHYDAGGMPEDAAKLAHFLQSDYSQWITGEVIASEGGFRRDVTLE